MKLKLKAKQYAEALFNVASQDNSEKAVKDSLAVVNSVLKSSSEFRAFCFLSESVKFRRLLL